MGPWVEGEAGWVLSEETSEVTVPPVVIGPWVEGGAGWVLSEETSEVTVPGCPPLLAVNRPTLYVPRSTATTATAAATDPRTHRRPLEYNPRAGAPAPTRTGALTPLLLAVAETEGRTGRRSSSRWSLAQPRSFAACPTSIRAMPESSRLKATIARSTRMSGAVTGSAWEARLTVPGD